MSIPHLPTVRFYTFGCKLNQCETEGIASAFKNAGFKIALRATEGETSFSIVNTCTVTSKAEQKARRVIRALLNDKANKAVIVTGCYAELNRADLETLDAGTGEKKRLFIVEGSKKAQLLILPASLKNLLEGGGNLQDGLCGLLCEPAAAGDFSFEPKTSGFHSRAFLKIEDGCDNSCTYCRVHLARGKSRSMSIEVALEHCLRLEQLQCAEVVLTGVNIGQWRNCENGIAALLKALIEGTKKLKFRLSSLDPTVFSCDLFTILKSERIQPHFHLSVQSGSGQILQKMGRRYTASDVLDVITKLRSIKNDPFLACDLICGFPGETEADFEQTMELCRRADFAWIHAFPFSPRPGTAAWSFKPAVPENISGERVRKLTSLGFEGKKKYIVRWLGKETDAVSLNHSKKKLKFRAALTDNYIKLFIKEDASFPAAMRENCHVAGKVFRCRITAPAESCLGDVSIIGGNTGKLNDFDAIGEAVS